MVKIYKPICPQCKMPPDTKFIESGTAGSPAIIYFCSLCKAGPYLITEIPDDWWMLDDKWPIGAFHPYDPVIHNITNETASLWRMKLKLAMLKEREWKSDLSKKHIPAFEACDMHEGIVTRADVRSSIWWQWMIFHPYNVFLLVREEHIPQPPSREACAQLAFDRYGQDKVVHWYKNLPWKGGIPREI